MKKEAIEIEVSIMDEKLQQSLMDFERNRLQLINTGNQKNQLQLQSNALALSLEELEKSLEKKVYKAIGNILILTDKEDIKKETIEQKEIIDLRIKSLQKQEDNLTQKLNNLKKEIESKEVFKEQASPKKNSVE